MKIVLLPGMDGTGELFGALLPYLQHRANTKVIVLPTSGDQSYNALKEQVKEQLPDEDYILVAESFSGPIAVLLAREGLKNLKRVVFVASFVTPPKKRLLSLFMRLPVKTALNLPFSSTFIRWFMLGREASSRDVAQFKRVVGAVPSSAIKKRLATIASLSLGEGKVSVPAVYIRADSDRLVSPHKSSEFRLIFDDCVVRTVKGPHFVLQANPRSCAAVINGAR